MKRTFEDTDRDGTGDVRESGIAPQETRQAVTRSAGPRVLVVDLDCALHGLLEEWLVGHGCAVAVDDCRGQRHTGHFDLVIADLPFPRRGGSDVLQGLRAEFPGVPILALSSSFFAGVATNGPVAQELGVAAVLPKPLNRATLLAAVDSLLPAQRR